MNVNRFFVNRSTLVVLIACLLSASALRAQTFVGHEKLTQSPSQLEATVYPLTNAPSTIKVIFNNLTGGQVRVVIRDEKGKVVYSEFESIARYRRCFDLSYLTNGRYTVELSKKNESYTRAFAVEPATTMSRIALVDEPVRKTPKQPADTKLIVSQ